MKNLKKSKAIKIKEGHKDKKESFLIDKLFVEIWVKFSNGFNIDSLAFICAFLKHVILFFAMSRTFINAFK